MISEVQFIFEILHVDAYVGVTIGEQRGRSASYRTDAQVGACEAAMFEEGPWRRNDVPDTRSLVEYPQILARCSGSGDATSAGRA
jgi:hypothetical protein